MTNYEMSKEVFEILENDLNELDENEFLNLEKLLNCYQFDAALIIIVGGLIEDTESGIENYHFENLMLLWRLMFLKIRLTQTFLANDKDKIEAFCEGIRTYVEPIKDQSPKGKIIENIVFNFEDIISDLDHLSCMAGTGHYSDICRWAEMTLSITSTLGNSFQEVYESFKEVGTVYKW